MGKSSMNCVCRLELIQGILISLRASQDWSGQSKPQNCFLNKTGQSLFKKTKPKPNLTSVVFASWQLGCIFLVCGSLIHQGVSQRGWHYSFPYSELSCLWVLGSSRVEKAKLIWVQVLVHRLSSPEMLASYLTFSNLSSSTKKFG